MVYLTVGGYGGGLKRSVELKTIKKVPEKEENSNLCTSGSTAQRGLVELGHFSVIQVVVKFCAT